MKKKKVRVIGVLISLVLVVGLVIPMIATSIIYEDNFGKRYETRGWWINDISEYKGLKREKAIVKSNNEQKLAAYTYYNENTVVPKAVVILAHGLGAGHMAYMTQIDYLTKNDYLVFAYDVTGNDESEGKSIEGIPQAVIDLDNVISYVEKDSKLNYLPIMLYGHSWGGYAVSAVLNYEHNIKAVVEMSGFNSSQDIILEKGRALYGDIIDVLSPYIKIYEWVKFGKVADLTSLEGLTNTKAKVLLIHGNKDKTVSYNNNFIKYMNVLGDKRNLIFKTAKNYGHQLAFTEKYNKTMHKCKKEAISQYGDINNVPENVEKALVESVKSFPNKLNNDRMEAVVQFYDSVIKQDYLY